MPQTFDPGDFDIHEFEKGKPEVLPVTKKEKIDPRTLKGTGETEPVKKPKKRIFLAVVANIFLPGLGNILVKKTLLGKTLLAANVLLLATTVSPTSFLGFLGNIAYPRTPPALIAGISIAPLETGGNIVTIDPQIQALFYVGIALALLAWIHLFYLLAKKR